MVAVERAQEAVERIQSVALDKRREHREALTLARGEGGKSERAAAALVAKQKAKELKVALGLCLRAKEEVNECIRKVGSEEAADPVLLQAAVGTRTSRARIARARHRHALAMGALGPWLTPGTTWEGLP